MSIHSLCKPISTALTHNLRLGKSAEEQQAFAAAALEQAAETVFPELDRLLAARGEGSEEYQAARMAVLDLLMAAGIPYVRNCTAHSWGVDFLNDLAGKSTDPQVKKKLVVYSNQIKKRWNEAEPGGVRHAPRAKRFSRAEKKGSLTSILLAIVCSVSCIGATYYFLSSDLTSSVFPSWKSPEGGNADISHGQTVVEERGRSPEATVTEPAAPHRQSGDFCRYTDENGTIHIVNDAAKVPERYRLRMEIVASGDCTTAVECSGNRVLVPVTLRYRGREVRTMLLLDTGASLTTINERVALRLAIDQSDMRPAVSTVADGRTVPAFNFAAESVTVGPRSLPGAIVSILPGSGGNGADGLLGMNFLKEFRYHVDFRRGVIEWGS